MYAIIYNCVTSIPFCTMCNCVGDFDTKLRFLRLLAGQVKSSMGVLDWSLWSLGEYIMNDKDDLPEGQLIDNVSSSQTCFTWGRQPNKRNCKKLV